MRKSILAMGLLLALAGCTPAATAEFIGAVQEQSAKLCKFVPLAGTVGAIVGTMTGDPAIGTGVAAAKVVADKVCAAVANSKQTNALYKEVPTVNGVPVEGYWVE